MNSNKKKGGTALTDGLKVIQQTWAKKSEQKKKKENSLAYSVPKSFQNNETS